MDVLAPPSFGDATLLAVLAEHYGVAGQLHPLSGERHQIVRVEGDSGQRFILKIANPDEDPTATDFQLQAMMHLEHVDCLVTVPRVVNTVAGKPFAEMFVDSKSHVVQLLSYVDGVLLCDATLSSDLLQNFGRRLAQLGVSLRDFEHPGDRPLSFWDMQRALHVRSLLRHIEDLDVREATSTALDDFEQRALPHFPGLRQQIIHDDANPDNVLVYADMSDVVGFFDFGDILRAPLVVDVAVAASYLRSFGDDPLKFISPFVAGYHSVTEFHDTELGLLFDLIRTRVATSVANQYRLKAARGDDGADRAREMGKEPEDQQFLACLDELGRESFNRAMQGACAVPEP